MRAGNGMASSRRRSVAFAGMLAASVALAAIAASAADEPRGREFRVCADPNNLPFSSSREDGLENKLADLFARELGETVSYTWWAEHRGFIRNTLKAKKCDVVMGVPTGMDMVETTRPYYRSTYVFVSRADRHLDIASIADPRLRTLKVGVQLVGNDGFNTPPAHALADQGIIRNVVGYSVYGDYRERNPPARIVAAVARGKIDIAAVWGPLAGYFSQQSPVPLELVPITGAERFAPLVFQFDMAMGVRKGDEARKAQLDRLIAQNQEQIEALLKAYAIPVVANRIELVR